jgi:proline iminopeptidase
VEMVRMEDGVRVRTWTSGTVRDSAPVLFIHGGPGMWDYLGPVADMLAPITMVHRFDQRGCGGSDPSEGPHVRYLSGVGVGGWHSLYRSESLRRMTPDQRQRLDELNALADRSESEEREFWRCRGSPITPTWHVAGS